MADDLLKPEGGSVGDPDEERKKIESPENKQKLRLRGLSFRIVVGVVVVWIIMTLFMVYWQATGNSMRECYVDACHVCNPEPFFHLDNSVLIALITTASANVIALFVIILKHLYPESGK